MKDLYEVLGVTRSASADEIKSAYRKLAREKHPDVNAHRRQEAEAEFKEIGAAYGVLSDEAKRAHYDRYGEEGMNGSAGGGVNFSGGGLGDLFDVLINGAAGNVREQVRRGSDLRMNVKLTLEEIYAGVGKDLQVPTLLQCETCSGNGAAPGTDVQTCVACSGSGRQREVRQTFFGQFAQEVPCARCAGRGRIIETPCQACRGDGRVRGKRSVSVDFPAGLDEGDRVRISGAGEDGELGTPPGDLYCVVYVEENRYFQRAENDVVYIVSVSFPQAGLGDTLRVPTLERDENGEILMGEITVPAGTQTGSRFRIADKGFPNRYGQRGDQICIARVTTPTKLTDRQKELLREFAEESQEFPEEHPRGFFDKLKDVFIGD